MPKLVNIENNQLVDLPHQEAGSAFLSGKFNLPSAQPVVMANQKGELMTVEPGEVHKALTQGGYSFADPVAVNEADLQAKYGEGLSNEAAAFGLGAANVATFGAASPLLQASNLVSTEALKEIPARSPVAHTLGQVAGALAPIPGAAPSLIAKAGLSASEALLKALPAATSFGGRLAAKTAAGAVGGAVEGALFETGNQVSESTLGDPNFTAQRVAAHIGLSGLFGGGLGSLLGASSVVVPSAIGKAREGIERVFKGIGGDEAAESGFVKAAAFVSGKPAEDIRTALRNRGFDNSPSKVREFSEDLTKSLQNQYDTMEKAARDVNRHVRPEESAKLVSNMDPAPIYDLLSKTDSKLQEAIANMRSKPELYPGRFPAELEEIAAAFTRDTVEGASSQAGFKALNDLKRNLDTQIKFGRVPSEESMKAKDLFKQLRGGIKNDLESEAIFGAAGARQQAFNEAHNEFRTFHSSKRMSELQRRFMLKRPSKGGQDEWFVDPVKVNRYLNNIDDVRGAENSKILDDYAAMSRKYLDQVELSYKNLPGEADKEAIKRMVKLEHGVDADGAARVPKGNVVGEHGPTAPAAFHKSLAKAAEESSKVKEFVHFYSPEELAGMKTYLHPDGKSGFAVKPDGDLVSVFSTVKGRGDSIVQQALEEGATKLDAFDGYLPGFYKKHGFKEYKREANWTPGGPDVVYMQQEQAAKGFNRATAQGILDKTKEVRGTFEGHAAVKRAFDRLKKSPGGEYGAILATQVAHASGVPYPIAAPLVGLYEILRNPGTAIQRLSKLEGVVNKVSQSINKDALAVFKPSAELGAKITGAAASYLSEAQFEKNVAQVNQLGNNLEDMTSKLEHISEQMAEHAPQTAMAMQQTAIRAVQFLQSKVPVAPENFPLQAKWKPGASDVARFNRYWGAVESPLSVYKQLRAGTLTHESIEALQTVYPALHQDMQRSVIEAMVTHKSKMPYSTRVQLSLFLGKDLTASTSPKAILSNQVVLQGPSGQQQGQPSKGKVPVSTKFSSSSSLLTPMQRGAQRAQ